MHMLFFLVVEFVFHPTDTEYLVKISKFKE